MRKINLSLVAVLAMSTFAIAGGDIAPVEPVIEEVTVEEVEEEVEEVAENGFYLGAGFSLLRSGSSFLETTLLRPNLEHDHKAVMLQTGYKFNKYIGVEGRYWAGLTTNDITLKGNPFNTSVDAWGIYVKPMYPITSTLDIYGLLGYGASTSRNVPVTNTIARDFDAHGLSWGVGTSYSFTKNIAVFVDYVDFQDDHIFTNTSIAGIKQYTGTFDHAIDTLNFGVTYQF